MADDAIMGYGPGFATLTEAQKQWRAPFFF
jgi:hypothetical protein